MNRRFFIMMGVVAAVFCVGALFFGVDAQSIGRRAAARQKQQAMAINEQLQDNPTPKSSDDDVVSAGY